MKDDAAAVPGRAARDTGVAGPSPLPPFYSQASSGAAPRAGVPDWLPALRSIVGDEHVLTGEAERYVYSRDRSPYAIFRSRNAAVPSTLPSAVACPGSVPELAAVVRFARERRIPLIPYGAGSGVLGGALPIAHELMVDVKRLNRLLKLCETSRTVVVQAGMNGAQLEQALNARGYTCGHHPQSLHMSTVGGWAACRGAGQSSTRYGKIEDMVVGCEIVLPDGRTMRVRATPGRAVGPNLQEMFVGSEGVFGIITELTLRFWRLPEASHGVILAFPALQSGLDALREVVQEELRPAVVRLYDREESRQRTNDAGAFAERPFLAMLEFCGSARMAAFERDLALEITAAHGAVSTDTGIYDEWQRHRYQSYSVKWQARDYYVDTIDVTASWPSLPGMYERMRAAVSAACPEAAFGAHWSHFYPEGACQYMTVRLPPMPETAAFAALSRIWDDVQRECLAAGGSISHHHGVGLFRGRWMSEELGPGLEILQALKDHLDPDTLFVPGKLGLRRPGSGE